MPGKEDEHDPLSTRAVVDRIARTHGGTFELLPRAGGGLVPPIALRLAADPAPAAASP